jgi:hypothetical protein
MNKQRGGDVASWYYREVISTVQRGSKRSGARRPAMG